MEEIEEHYHTKDIWYLLGPPPEDSQYPLGIEDPQAIFDQW